MSNPYGVLSVKAPTAAPTKGDPVKSCYLKVTFPPGIAKEETVRSEKVDDYQFKLSHDVEMTAAVQRDTMMTVQIMQYQLLGSDKAFATAKVPMDPLEIGNSVGPDDYDFKDAKGQSLAKVNFSVGYKDGVLPEAVQAAAAGAASGLAKPLGGKPGEKALPLPDCENNDYSVRVKIHKCKNLQNLRPDKLYDPRIILSCKNKTYKTEVIKDTMDPTFDEECAFNFVKVQSNFWTEILQIAVVSDHFGLPDEKIGYVQFDVGTIYRSNLQHAIVRKWFVIIKDPGQDGSVMGYLKASVSVLNLRTDNLVEFEDEDDNEEERDEDITNNLVNVTGAAFEEIFLHIDAVACEGLPKMDSGINGSCDPYAKFTFGKNSVETCHVADTFNARWDTRLMLSAMMPALSSTLKVVLMDYDSLSLDDTISTTFIDLADIARSGSGGNLPMLAPRYINTYGCPRSCDADYNRYYKDMVMGRKKGLDFRGRILMRIVGSRSKILPPMPTVRESRLHVEVWVEIMQCSQLPGDDKYKIKASVGTMSGSTAIHASSKMVGDGIYGHALYMGDKINFKTVIPVIVPTREDLYSTSLEDRREYDDQNVTANTDSDEEEEEESSDHSTDSKSSKASAKRKAALEARLVKEYEKVIWDQIPGLVVHLITDSALSAFADKLTGAKDEDPTAAVVFPPQRFHRSGGSFHCSKAMRMMTDPDAAKSGRAPANPLVQINCGMAIRSIEPAPELPIPTSQVPPRYIAASGRMHTFILSVFVYHARNVPAADDNGLSDPYVTVTWANAGARTRTVKETLNPTFNEALYITSMVKDPLPDLVVTLYDWDLIGRDDFLCKSYIDLKQIKSNKPFWVTHFTDSYGKHNDTELLISVMLEPTNDEKAAALRSLKKVPMLQHRDSRKTTKCYPIPAAHQLKMSTYSLNAKVFGLRHMRKYHLRDVTSPKLEFECYGNVAASDRKEGRNADFDAELNWILTLPDVEEYLPFLNIFAYDHRLGLRVLVAVAQMRLSDHSLSIVWKRHKKGEDNERVKLHLRELLEYERKMAEKELDSSATTPADVDRPSAVADAPQDSHPSLLATSMALGALGGGGGGGRSSPTEPTGATTTEEMRDMQKAGAAAGSPLGRNTERFGQQIDDKIKQAQTDQLDELQYEASETTSVASTEPDELLWFDRFDPASAGGGGEEVTVPYERRVARLGKLCKKVRSLGAGGSTAERVFGPFDDQYTAVALFRGQGSKGAKAGQLNVDMNFSKLTGADENGNGAAAPAAAAAAAPRHLDRAAEARWNPCTARKKTPFLCRVYILEARELTAMDSGVFGKSSDPYCVLTLAGTPGQSNKSDVIVNCKDQIRYQTLAPDWYFVRELSGELPQHSNLRISIHDWDRVGFDELIGFTDINLEERYYSTRGYIKNRTVPFPGRTPDREDPAAYYGLNHHGSYTERRLLRDESGLAAGTVELWVDIFDFATPVPRPIDVAPPPPIPLELRCSVWNVRDCELVDEAITGELMTDIYVKAWMEGMDNNAQCTDVHYRSLDGAGNFNWRMSYPVVFDPRLKKVFPVGDVQAGASSSESGGAASTASRSLFGVRKEAKKLKPRLVVQLWDNDILPLTDDYVGANSLNLLSLVPAYTRRLKDDLLGDMTRDCQSCTQSFPWNLCCVCACCKPDKNIEEMTLKERQLHARKEMRQERDARDEHFAAEVARKLEALEDSFSEEELPAVKKRLLRRCKKAARMNIFQDFLPQRRKKSQMDAADKAHAEEMEKKVAQHADDPTAIAGKADDDKKPVPVATSNKAWFMCRSPSGGVRVGDVQLSFELVRLDAIEHEPDRFNAGKGRSEPQALPEPDRPESSFFWLSSPFKAASHILWKNYRTLILTAICIFLSLIVLYLFTAEAISVKTQQLFT